TERTRKSGCQNEKHHDGTVNGHQSQISIVFHNSSRSHFLTQENFKHFERFLRPSYLHSKEYRHCNTYNTHYHTGNKVLFSNHLVVYTKDILRNESILVMMMFLVIFVSCC